MGFEQNMSTDEGPELRELVAQTLENNGVLSKIRAELRASVFLALEEQESFQEKIPFINKSLKEFLKTSQGLLVACLVREFLEFFELDFTLSVFDPETYHGKDYDYCGRNKLISDLQIKNVNEKRAPLLSHILQLVSSKLGDGDIVSSIHEDSALSNGGCKGDPESNLNQNIFNLAKEKDSSNILDKTYTASDVHRRSQQTETQDFSASLLKSLQNPTFLENTSSAKSTGLSSSLFDFPFTKKSDSSEAKEVKKKSAEVKISGEESLNKQGVNSLTSLGNLPPLLGMAKTSEKPNVTNNVKDTGQGKSVLDLVLEAYDEDFQSSVSGSGHDGKNTVPNSDTEIEEDIGSGVDDLLSNASVADDVTVDATVSNMSGIGDYMENV